jgi:hypothetical protein
MTEEKDRFYRCAAWAEGEFKYVSEFSLAMTFDLSALLAGQVGYQIHCGVNCLPVFTWRFLQDEVPESLPEPLLLLFDVAKYGFGIHSTDVIAIK